MQSNKELKSKFSDIHQRVEDVNQIVDFELDNANNQVEVLANETQRLKQKALKSQVKYISLKSENDKLKDNIKQLKTDNILNNSQNDFLSSQLNKLKRENESLRRENERLKIYSPEAFQNILDELNESKANNATLMCQLRASKKIKKENDQLNQSFRTMQYSIDNLKEKNRKLNDELETAKIEKDYSNSLRQQLSESRRNNDHLLSQLKEMRSSKDDLEIAQTCLRNSDKKVESLKDENTRLALSLSKATSENIKLKSQKQELKEKIAQLTCEVEQLRDRNSNSIMLLSNLQTENDELKESLGHSNNLLSQVFDDKKARTYQFDDDDFSTTDVSSDESFDPHLPCIIQSIGELKKSVSSICDYKLQSQLTKLASKLEKVARDALIKSSI